jgi:hypothetical protein
MAGVVLVGILACMLSLSGCKTKDDASAAATQMSATAKCLSDYYVGVEAIVDKTDQINILNEGLFAKPYPQKNRDLLKADRAEIEKRAALAGDLSKLAAEFALLAGSKAPADVAASALKLQGEVDSLSGTTSSSTEQSVLKASLQLLVTAIQEHKEREAARAIDGVAKGMSDLFVKEEPVWKSLEEVYTEFAAGLAADLVDQKSVDTTTFAAAHLKMALDPFGLAASPPSADVTAKLAPVVKQEIADRHAALDSDYAKATEAMAKSLEEMSKRIHVVAEDKPMEFRAPPLTLATVEKWASAAASF